MSEKKTKLTVTDKLGEAKRIGKKVIYQVKPDPVNIHMKELKLNFEIPNTGVKLTAKLNPKTYRKVLKTLEEHQNEVALILQGKITKNMNMVEEAGITAQPKAIKIESMETPK